ncbi:MAG: glycerophosphodiester phosphodiesterase family protein [Bacteriovoracaceae bacterium]|nr:T9SS type A sorting domain-containing protein [Bacteroidota bacterium]
MDQQFFGPKIIVHLFLLTLLVGMAVTAQTLTAIGHRGASSIAPENTLAAFNKAIDLGVDYFELDVRTTADDSLVIMHDEFVTRTTNGTGSVQSKTYESIRTLDAGSKFSAAYAGEKVPSLYEALKLAKDRHSKVCIHIYVADIANVVKLLQAMKMQPQVVIFSFEFAHLQQTKNLDSTIAVLYLADAATGNEAVKMQSIKGEYIGIGDTPKFSAINYAHSLGIKYFAWTIDAVDKMKSAVIAKVDGIISNYPQILVPMRDSLKALDVVNITEGALNGYSLVQNYPNPFNPSTTISYILPRNNFTTLKIYDMLGNEIALLIQQEQSAGSYSVSWNATNVSSGVYYYRLSSGGFSETKRMLLLQ